MTSSSSGCRDRRKGALMDISSSCLHILMETSSSRTIDHINATSRGTKKRKAPDTDAADQEILHKRSPLGRRFCEHDRQHSRCKECGGSRICEHGRMRYQCKECGGAGICEPGRQRYQCKECGGGGICEHGRMRYRCKECGFGIFKVKASNSTSLP